jgi:hypothetical protein
MTEQPPERPTKKRRLRWIAVTILLLPVWYVASWLLAAKALANRYIPKEYATTVVVPFKPLIAYANSDAPGASPLSRLFLSVIWDDFYHSPSYKLSGLDDRHSVGFGPLSPRLKMSLYQEMREEHDGDATPYR